MKVQLLVSRSGPAGAQNRGDVIEVSEAEAKRMMEAVPPHCAPVREEPPVETADSAHSGEPTVEVAAKRAGRKPKAEKPAE